MQDKPKQTLVIVTHAYGKIKLFQDIVCKKLKDWLQGCLQNSGYRNDHKYIMEEFRKIKTHLMLGIRQIGRASVVTYKLKFY